MIAYVTETEIRRWREEGREDIFHIIENESAMWAGDHLISRKDGRYLHGCPFLKWEGNTSMCTIYETRPGVCRDYEPGSSELCPRYKK